VIRSSRAILSFEEAGRRSNGKIWEERLRIPSHTLCWEVPFPAGR
jgi:hypothetical protein